MEEEEERERKRENRGNGRLSIGVAKSNVAAPPRKLVAEKTSAIYKPPLLFRLYNPERIKDSSGRHLSLFFLRDKKSS